MLRKPRCLHDQVVAAAKIALIASVVQRIRFAEWPGTPLENRPPVDIFELVRLIATTRIALPEAKVRLSAGRTMLSKEAQALCIFAGANSIFYGEKLLTAENPGVDHDRELLSALDLAAQPPFAAGHLGP